MTAVLWYGAGGFDVSNSTKDLIYEISLAVAERTDAALRQRLADDGRLAGCYGVGGMGFDLAAFVEAFGSVAKWRQAITQNFNVVEEVCADPVCVEHMTKVFASIWRLLEVEK